DPEEVLGVGEVGDVVADDGDGDAVGTCGLDPGVAVGAVAPPGVALGLEVLEQAGEFGGEFGVGEDTEATQVGDVVEVLDVDGALVDAGAAVGAGPQDVVGDDVGHAQYVDTLVLPAERGVADVGHEELRVEGLAGVQGEDG